jgi:hypothetical protein
MLRSEAENILDVSISPSVYEHLESAYNRQGLDKFTYLKGINGFRRLYEATQAAEREREAQAKVAYQTFEKALNEYKNAWDAYRESAKVSRTSKNSYVTWNSFEIARTQLDALSAALGVPGTEIIPDFPIVETDITEYCRDIKNAAYVKLVCPWR